MPIMQEEPICAACSLDKASGDSRDLAYLWVHPGEEDSDAVSHYRYRRATRLKYHLNV